MASLMDSTPALPTVEKVQKEVRADDQIRAECHLRTLYPGAMIKYLYHHRNQYSYRVNEYAPDYSRIVNSDFIVVTVDSEVDHEIRTVR